MSSFIKSFVLVCVALALPAVALASGGGAEAAHSNPWMDLAFKFVNFFILVGILWYVLKGIIPQALRDRKDGIAKELKEALAAKEEAETKLSDFEGKVANLQAEIAEMMENFAVEGANQKKKIIAEAKVAAENIKKNAAAAGEREALRATEELKSEAVRLALEAAQRILAESYSAEDQKRALEQTIEKIEGIH